jgi:hypothetical protein
MKLQILLGMIWYTYKAVLHIWFLIVDILLHNYNIIQEINILLQVNMFSWHLLIPCFYIVIADSLSDVGPSFVPYRGG